MSRRAVAVVIAVLALAGCANTQSDAASTPIAPSSVIVNEVRYILAAEQTLAEDLAEIKGNRGGYTTATSVYVDPEPQNGAHGWYVLNTAFLSPTKSLQSSLDSHSILLVHSKEGGYQLDAAAACKVITDAKATRKARSDLNIRFDKAVIKVRANGDTCGAAMPRHSS